MLYLKIISIFTGANNTKKDLISILYTDIQLFTHNFNTSEMCKTDSYKLLGNVI